jgi:hypothetical protein
MWDQILTGPVWLQGIRAQRSTMQRFPAAKALTFEQLTVRWQLRIFDLFCTNSGQQSLCSNQSQQSAPLSLTYQFYDTVVEQGTRFVQSRVAKNPINAVYIRIESTI